MPRQKSFSYIIRVSQAGSELLVFDSLEEPGLEVPKGSAQPGESPALCQPLVQGSNAFVGELMAQIA